MADGPPYAGRPICLPKCVPRDRTGWSPLTSVAFGLTARQKRPNRQGRSGRPVGQGHTWGTYPASAAHTPRRSSPRRPRRVTRWAHLWSLRSRAPAATVPRSRGSCEDPGVLLSVVAPRPWSGPKGGGVDLSAQRREPHDGIDKTDDSPADLSVLTNVSPTRESRP